MISDILGLETTGTVASVPDLSIPPKAGRDRGSGTYEFEQMDPGKYRRDRLAGYPRSAALQAFSGFIRDRKIARPRAISIDSPRCPESRDWMVVGTGADFYGPFTRGFETARFMRTSVCQQIHSRSVSATKSVPLAHSPGGVFLRRMA